MPRTTEKEPAVVADHSNGNGDDMLQTMADTLLQQATLARSNGDKEGAARLLRAAASIMGGHDMPESRGDRSDGRKQTTPETEKIKAMLREGWREAHELQEATGLNPNRVHALLGRLKDSRELRFEKRTVTQYRILP